MGPRRLSAPVESRPGISHVVEHLVFEQARRKSGAILVSANALTSFLWTRFDARVNVSGLEPAFDFLSRLRDRLDIETPAFEIQKSIVLQETREKERFVPELGTARVFDKSLFQGTAFENWPLGSVEEIERITSEHIKEFHEERYISAGSLTVVVGPADYSEVKSKAKKFSPTIKASLTALETSVEETS